MKSLGRLFQLFLLAMLFPAAHFPATYASPRATPVALPDRDPWNPAETISPADFAKELQPKPDPSLKIIHVGVRTLFSGGHIPGSVFAGPGSTAEGIAALKKYAATLPKNSNLVVYCGCCPLDRCPNLRPAFLALQEMGFTHLRVLLLPTSFAADWVEKGYPIEKGASKAGQM
jgi:thiosulfate/3-mercaptopyruvate sulfurtransferase